MSNFIYWNVIIEIVDLQTGEILVESRSSRPLFSYGLQGVDYFYKKFCEILRSGTDCTINISAFDSRCDIRDAEDIFITSKKNLPF